jgi:preprotein translocase SecE subunit
MKKVTWPTREQVKNYMVVVVIASFALAVVIGIWDVILLKLLEQITTIGG